MDNSDNLEIPNQMKEIYKKLQLEMKDVYKECNELYHKFVKDEECKYACYEKCEEGEWYLPLKYSDEVKLKADKYYQKCLDERSIRVPKLKP